MNIEVCQKRLDKIKTEYRMDMTNEFAIEVLSRTQMRDVISKREEVALLMAMIALGKQEK